MMVDRRVLVPALGHGAGGAAVFLDILGTAGEHQDRPLRAFERPKRQPDPRAADDRPYRSDGRAVLPAGLRL